jgi:hypothetical protein
MRSAMNRFTTSACVTFVKCSPSGTVTSAPDKPHDKIRSSYVPASTTFFAPRIFAISVVMLAS